MERPPHPFACRPLDFLVAAAAVVFAFACTPAAGETTGSEPVPVAPDPGERTSGSATQPAPTARTAPARPDADGARAWPSTMVVGAANDPAKLYIGPGAEAAAVGFVYPGAIVTPKGAASSGRLPVEVQGNLGARGWVALERLAVRAQRTCRLGGSPAYLGPNDVVEVVGLDPRGLLEVRARPGLGVETSTPLPPFQGVCPIDRFAGSPVTGADGPSPGQAFQLPAGTRVPLYDRPDGDVVVQLPATDPPLTLVVLRDRGTWKGVRVGTGPYLIGYVSATLTPADRAPQAAPAPLPALPALADGAVPAAIVQNSQDRPLWRVRTGTRITFDDRAIGTLGGTGFAREMNRFDSGTVDVFIAADEGAAIRGMVPADALEAMPAPAARPTAPAAAPPARDDDEPYVPGGTLRRTN